MKKFWRKGTIATIEKFIQMYNTVLEVANIKKGRITYDEQEIKKIAKDFKITTRSLKVYFRGFRTAYKLTDVQYFTTSSFKELTGLEEEDFSLSRIGATSGAAYGKKYVKKKEYKAVITLDDESIINEFKSKVKILDVDLSSDVIDEFLDSVCSNVADKAKYISDRSTDELVSTIEKYYMDSLFSLVDVEETAENTKKFKMLGVSSEKNLLTTKEDIIANFKARALEVFPTYSSEIIDSFLEYSTDDPVKYLTKGDIMAVYSDLRFYKDKMDIENVAKDILTDPHDLSEKQDNSNNVETDPYTVIDSFDCAVDMVRSAMARMEGVLASVHMLNDVKTLEELEHIIATYKKALKVKNDFENMISINFEN